MSTNSTKVKVLEEDLPDIAKLRLEEVDKEERRNELIVSHI